MAKRDDLRKKRDDALKRLKELRALDQDENHSWTSEDEENWAAANRDYDGANAELAALNREERVAVLEAAETAEREAAELRGGSDPDPERERLAQELRQSSGPLPGSEPGEPPPRLLRPRQGEIERGRDYQLALRAWIGSLFNEPGDADFGSQRYRISEEERAACKRLQLNPLAKSIPFSFGRNYRAIRARSMRMARFLAAQHYDMPELRATALSKAATAGAELVPEGFMDALEVALLAFGGMRQVAQVLRTSTGQDLPWPTWDDTSQTGALVSELGTLSDSTVPVTGEYVYGAYKYTSNFIQVSFELLEDDAFDLAALVGEAAGTRIGRIQNTHFTTGDGSSKPRGLLTDTVLGVSAASATAVTSDELLDLIHSVDPAYRVGAGFMFRDAVLLALRKLADTTGRPLWQESVRDGEPGTIHGYPYTINQDMPAQTTGQKSIAFGQLGRYKVRDAGIGRLRRLEERFAEKDEVAFVALTRSDGALLDAGGNPVKHLAQA